MRNLVNNRNIQHVWHFTRIENLNFILQEGLKSRLEINNTQRQSIYNDEYRFDGHEDAICCSLGHPNYKMFYSLRQRDVNNEWVVIALKPEILWEKDCAFCVTNAASNSVTCIPIEQRKGIEAFNLMFNEINDKPTRQELGIPDSCPTDPQAEVLVFGNIEPSYIAGVVFQNQDRANEYAQVYQGFQLVYHRAHFMPRLDHRHW